MNEKKQMRKDIFERIVFVILCITAGILCVGSFAQPWLWGDCDGIHVLMTAFFYIIFLSGVTFLFRKLNVKVLCRIIWLGILAAFCIQLYIAFHMKLVPKVDLSHIYDQSIVMIMKQTVKFTDQEYFGFNTNNIPIAIVIYWVFRFANVLGCTDYRLAGGIFNVFMLLFFYCFSYQVLKKLTSVKTTAVLMVFLLTNPILYAYAAYYYTDTVSMPFTMLGILLILTAWKLENQYMKKILYYFTAGFIISFAAKIRVTSIFIVFAFVIFLLWRQYWKEFLRLLLGMLAGYLIFAFLWSFLYRYHIEFDTKNTAIPVEHFLMMGSNSKTTGKYLYSDVIFTQSFKTHEEKIANTRSVWIKRIREKGVIGNLFFVAKKEIIVWCMGEKGYIQYTENVEEETMCWQLISGSKSYPLRCYMQSYNGVMFLLISLGLFYAKKKENSYMLIFAIFWTGALVFYMLWEAHPRQSLSYSGIMTILILPFVEKKCREFTAIQKRKRDASVMECKVLE